jgi:uncharacterized protein (TIGR02588 family)
MKPGTTSHPGKNALEWTVFTCSCLLLAGVVAMLVKEALAWDDSPARLEATLGTPVAEHDRIQVPVELSNLGDQVAEQVQLEVLRQSSSGEQRAVLAFDFVPRDATRRGRVNFRRTDEHPGTYSIDVIGHEDP